MMIQRERSVAAQIPPADTSLPPELQLRVPEAFRRGWNGVTRRLLRIGLLLGSDAVASVVAVLLTVLFAQRLGLGTPIAADVIAITVFSAIIVSLVLASLGAYTELGSRRSVPRLLGAVTVAGALGVLHALLFAGSPLAGFGTLILGSYVVLAFSFIYAGRSVIEWSLQSAYARGYGQRRALVVGSSRETARVMRLIRMEGGADVRMVGRLSLPRKSEHAMESVLRELEPALRSNGASEVIFAASEASFEDFERLVQRCFEIGAPVSIAPHILHRINARLELGRTRVGAVLRLYPIGLGLSMMAAKRTVDVALSVVALLVLSPLLLLIAFVIRLDSPGPVIFRQTRTGLGGRSFLMYKFRTMVDGADEIKPQLQHLNGSGDPRLFKIKDDPRVTRSGRVLRRLSLDELPQLLNVLRGEMSLIGPRPFFPDDLDRYAPHHFERLSVLPGITGLWQVKGRSTVVDFEEVIRFDRHYIRNWSLWMDLKILGLTLPAVLRREGAF